MGSAARPGQIGNTSPEEAARLEEERKRKAAADLALYGPDGPGQREVNNQGDGGWIPGTVGDVSKAFITGAPRVLEGIAKGDPGTALGGAADLVTGGTATPLIAPAARAGVTALGTAAAGAVDALGNAIGGVGGGTVDQASRDAVANDVNSVRTGRDALLDQYRTAAARPVPNLDSPVLAPATQVDPTGVGRAATVAQTTVAPAAQVGAAPQIAAGTVQAARIAPVERVTASQVAPTQAAVAAPVTAATIDKGAQGEFRTDQRDLVGQLKAAAAGTVPSAAEAQLKRANDAAIRTQQSLVSGARGTSRLSQRLQSAANIADLQQKNANDTAGLRATEQKDARGQLQTALDSGRGQDIGLASTEAGFKQQANVVGSQLQTDVSKQTAEISAARAMKDADLKQQAAMGDAAAQNELARRQAELDTGASTATAGLHLDAAKANQGATVTTSLADQQAKNRMSELQAQIDAQRGLATAEQQNELTKLRATITSNEGQFNAGQTNDLSKTAAQLKLNADVSRMDAELRSRGLDDAQRQSLLDAYMKEQQQALGWDASQALINANTANANKELLVKGIDGLVSGVGKASTLSDQRAKRDIKKVSAAAIARLSKVVSAPKSWRYKGEHDDGHEHFGEMAQKLEKDPLGKKLVHEGGDGLKRVDYQGLTALVLAAALKGRKAARR